MMRTPLKPKRDKPRRSEGRVKHGRVKDTPDKTAEERRHLERVAAMPCLVCNSWPVDVHHVVGYADRMGRAPRRHDRVTPLCKEHHDIQHGPLTSVHALGHRGFYEEYRIDLMAEAERLWESGI